MKAPLSHQRAVGRLIAAAASVFAIAGAVLAATLTATSAVAQSTESPAAVITAVASVGITVSDLDRAIAFYTGVLSFTKVSEVESSGDAIDRLSGVFAARSRTAGLTLGDERIELTQYLAPEGRPIPADSRSDDRWFQHIAIVVSDMDKAYAHLRAHHVRHASSGPQTLPGWNPNAGGISAFYFKDPDGHVLEVIHFPAGKGDPRWQTARDQLFLGIDHTAIVTADTDRSLSFYRDVLGMRIAGASENYGPEQEHLNSVFGARLRITTLRAASGPGVELLEYLAPNTGRPYPPDARANDLLHYHTTLITPDPLGLEKRLRETHSSWVSPGFVAASSAGVRAACQVRDPDGHPIVILQTQPEHAVAPGRP